MFSPLELEQMYDIVDLQMTEIHERLEEHGLEVVLTKEAREWLAEVGYDQAFGARPLRRALQKYVESPLSVKLLSGEFHEGDAVIVDVNEDDEVFFTQNEEKKKNGSGKGKKTTEAEIKSEVEEITE